MHFSLSIIFMTFLFSFSHASEKRIVCEFQYSYVNAKIGDEVVECNDTIYDNTFGGKPLKKKFKTKEDAINFIEENKRFSCIFKDEVLDFDERFRYFSCYQIFLDSSNK